MAALGGVRAVGSPEAAAAGAVWFAAGRTALLQLPSALVPRELKYVINPAHAGARLIRITTPAKSWRSLALDNASGSQNK